jgi:outer membrane immunogenic protein
MKTTILFGISAAVIAVGPALAADLPVKAPPAPLPPPFSWTGLYIGANIGGAWSQGSITDNVTGAQLNSDSSGFIGGGQIGYNYQINQFVLGVEWDIDGTSISKTSNAVTTAIGTLQLHASTDWITTLTGRIGVGWDRWLFYFKGGGAWVQNSVTLNNLTTGASASASNDNSGWTVGLGGEWAFAPQWSAKIEYDWVKLDNWSPSTSVIAAGDTLTLSRHMQMVKAGINYRFNWGGGY